LGTKLSAACVRSITGWRPSSMREQVAVVDLGRDVAVLAARWAASAESTSTVASASAVSRMRPTWRATSSRSSLKISYSRSRERSSAFSTLPSNSLSSGVM
jgi:hypothetical protein